MPGFNSATRRKIIQLPTMNRPTGGGTVQVQLPKVGLLARVWLAVRGSVAGTLTVPNALGKASIINRVRLTANSGVDIYNSSGAGFHYLLRPMIESEYIDMFAQTDARSAVAAGTFNADMVIPCMMNLRDPVGLIMLQNEQTVISLSVTFEADATVATGATVTATVTPYLEIFTVPANAADQPALNVIHQVLEDASAVSGAGQLAYNWPRGNTYLQIGHGLGMGAAGSDLFTTFAVRINQSEYLQTTDTVYLDMEHNALRGRPRLGGTVPVDLLGTSGLGNYGLTRDLFNSALVTDLASVFQATGAGTLYTLRRQLVVTGA